MTPATTPFPTELSGELEGVIHRYLTAAERQRASMLGAEMEMEIDGRFTRLNESGKLRALRTISNIGELGMRTLVDFTGDNRVKKYLIARFLEEEQKTKSFGAMTITPQDYDFTIRLITKRNGQDTYVFGVTPRSGGKGTFKGEVWVDGRTGMPLREAGQLVKSPHILLTNLRFTRDYELQNGIAVVKHFSSSTEVRLLGIGKAELDIDFTNFKPAPAEQALRDDRL
jgi:hypothetical protein